MDSKALIITGSVLIGITVLCGLIVLILQLRAHIITKQLKNDSKLKNISAEDQESTFQRIKVLELWSAVLSTIGIILALITVILNLAFKQQNVNSDSSVVAGVVDYLERTIL